MATIDVTGDSLVVRFTAAEKVGGLLRDLEVPLSSVTAVSVEEDALAAPSGLRAPGLALPGRRKIGTWRHRGRRTAVSVRSGEPAVRVGLAGERYDELLVGTPQAGDVAARLTSVR